MTPTELIDHRRLLVSRDHGAPGRAGGRAAEPGLIRGLNLTMATAVVIGTMIGTGVFLKPAEVAGAAGSVEWALAAWGIGGLFTLLAALCYLELGTMMPAAGADYVFLTRAFNPLVGFLYGWKSVAVSHPASLASYASGIALFASFFWPGLSATVAEVGGFSLRAGQVLAAFAILAVTALNLLAVSTVGRVQTVLTGLKVASVVIVIGVGLWFTVAVPAPAASAARAVTTGGFLAAVTATLWAYSGFHTLLRVGSEVQDPGRTLPRATIGGFAITALLFILINVVSFTGLGFDVVAGSSHVASDLLARAIGPVAGGVITVMMLVSVLGSLNTSALGSSRIPYAMARDGLLPAMFARVDPVRRSPRAAVVVPSLMAIVLVLTGSFEDLTSLFVFTQWLFFALGVAGLFRLRRLEPDTPRPVRAPGYPVLPALFVLIATVLTVSLVVQRPVRSVVGLALILAGIPVYLFVTRRRG